MPPSIGIFSVVLPPKSQRGYHGWLTRYSDYKQEQKCLLKTM